jgi:HD-like signal output (HDOD) protein
MSKTVMFVDDESFILRSLKRLFKNEPYNVILMNSAADALDYLKNNSVDLVISDIRMPRMDGFEFLSIVKKEYPKILRVALSGFTESKTIYKLIEKNIAKLYLFKPWDNYELKLNIKRILEFEDVLMNNSLLELINNLDSIPSLPSLYLDLRKLIDNEADIDEVGKLIEMDQAISSKVLRLANSAFYGRKTGDVSHAIMGIGLNNLKSLVLASTFFKGSKEDMQEIGKLWHHSVNTNKLTIKIYEKLLGKKIPSIYGSAGLLHDIGKVILHVFYSSSYKEILENSNEDENILVSAELSKYNITHQDVGAYLLNWWELPYAYVEAAMYHHRPSDERVVNYELVAVVHLANHYSLKMMMNEKIHSYLDPRVFSKLDIKQDEVIKLVEEIMQE